MRDKKAFEVEGFTYEIFPMEVEESLDILVKLMRIVGGSVGQGIAGADSAQGLLDKDLNQLDLGAILNGLATRLNEDEVKLITRALLDQRYVAVKGTPGKPGGPMDHKEHFRGRIGAMMLVMGKALEVNYADFFGSIKAAFNTAAKKGKASTPA